MKKCFEAILEVPLELRIKTEELIKQKTPMSELEELNKKYVNLVKITKNNTEYKEKELKIIGAYIELINLLSNGIEEIHFQKAIMSIKSLTKENSIEYALKFY